MSLEAKKGASPREGRLLCIDYGEVRCGLAVTDPEQRIATRLGAEPTSQLLDYLAVYFSKHVVVGCVLGMPCGLDGRETDATAGAKALVLSLSRRFVGLPIYEVDERLSSVQARRSMHAAGLKKSQKKKKGIIDGIAAVLLLEGYLSSRRIRARQPLYGSAGWGGLVHLFFA